ncbi:MAG: gamma-glutamyltransferase [Gammaproteobacteria bacterium]|nr:gamma-glutamyltransferase [Gammaproteobacteria bacterium]
MVETWTVRKPVVESAGGVVVTQHHLASDIGAQVLRDGGNAVDAAVTAGFAIGTVEPWMSGLGGGGYMVVYRAEENRCHVVDFGMRSPLALNPADYPVTGGMDADLFGWPGVLDERNVTGPYSFAVPGFAAGMALALKKFGSLPLADALSPAIDSARRGLEVDWYATLKIAAAAPALARFEESARVYLPGGFAPAGEWGALPPRIRLGRLADTLERLASAGAEDFYRGELASAFIDDVVEAGGKLRAADLERYRARVVPALSATYRDAKVHAAPALTAGPSLNRALELLAQRLDPSEEPDANAYMAYVSSLKTAYSERLATMGDDGSPESCTTHLSVVDRRGNMVALTQTLLSVFGSKVMLPRTGVLMNNGVMWFDPRPGRPNSLGPGKRPLANMCPTVVERGDGARIALGASGGRRIMPAVFQLISFLVDYRMDLERAVHHGRVDASGGEPVIVDASLDPAIRDALSAKNRTYVTNHGVYPALFACPNVVMREESRGLSSGGAFVMSPWAKASAET